MFMHNQQQQFRRWINKRRLFRLLIVTAMLIIFIFTRKLQLKKSQHTKINDMLDPRSNLTIVVTDYEDWDNRFVKCLSFDF